MSKPEVWSVDEFGEPWLDNPHLIIANPIRRQKKMASKRRQPAALRKYWAARRGKKSSPRRKRRTSRAVTRRRSVSRKQARSNPYFLNARRRRSPSRRRYHRNPQLAGFALPGVMDVLSVGAGLVVPPLVASYIMPMLPEAFRSNRIAAYAVKAAAVVVPALVVKKFVSQRAGNLMLLGGAASFALDLIKDFAPGVIPGLGYQPLLGKYVVPRSINGGRAAGLPPMIASTPERLNPSQRF